MSTGSNTCAGKLVDEWNSIAYHICLYSTVNKHGTNNCVVNQSRVSRRGVNP